MFNGESAERHKHPKNVGPPYLLLQPLKLAMSNFVGYTTLIWYVAYKTTFRTKIGMGLD